ncbi:MAG: hypothetical protein QOH37_3879 [Nocardioidaceae bacterium]|jgi:hypothetical protein|nr:hypothetical protein [Nocardioidaceae bacterium]
MRRGFWFAAGAGAGAYAMVRARRAAEAFTADGLSDRWHALTLGARLFRDEVAQGQAEAEFDLRERFGLVPHGVPELVGSTTTTTGHTNAPLLERHQDEEGQS